MSAAYHHSLTIREQLCHSCTHCMKKCPTAAIRIEKGHAHVDPSKCIDCGQCMQACPHHAIGVEQTPFELLFSFKQRVAILPVIFFAQFEDAFSNDQICRALYDIGFTHIYLAEQGVDISTLLGLTEDSQVEKPVISTFCPSIISLIRNHYASLGSHLSRLRSPGQLTAIFARAQISQTVENPSEIGIFYVTPCPAKISEFKAEESDEERMDVFDGVLNLDTVYNMVSSSLTKNKKRFASEPYDGPAFPVITSNACTWSMINGECSNKTCRRLAIDEIHQVVDFLEYVEEDDDINIDFLEFKACSEGCVGGILCTRNKFLAKERIYHLASLLPQTLPGVNIRQILDQADIIRTNAYEANKDVENSNIVLDEDIETAIHKMEKVHKLTAALPGIDCGLCGAPTCRELAHDIAQGGASIRQCTVLRLKDPKELNTLGRIWGEKISQEDKAKPKVL